MSGKKNNDPLALHAHANTRVGGDADLGRGITTWVKQFLTLIGQCDDLDRVDEHGYTAMGILAANYEGGQRSELGMTALLNNGANPLKQGSKAWFLEIEAPALDESLLRSMAIWMCQHENDKPLRCPKGGNLAHVLAEKPELFETTTFSAFAPMPGFSLLAAWMNEKRAEDGATPLHVLWRAQNMFVWEATAALLNRKALTIEDMMIPDDSGVRVADLMEGALARAAKTKNPIPFDPKVWTTIRAALEQQRMEDTTPGANGAKGRGMRL